MAEIRFIQTRIWADDTFLGMSPEQKLIYIYLIQSPYTSQCGIYKLSIATMGLGIGLRDRNIQSAFQAFLLKYSDWVQYDEDTCEVAVLYWPKINLINANIKALKKAERDLQEVQSTELIKAVISRNSSTLSKMYLTRLRQIQIERINKDKLLESNPEPGVDCYDGNVVQLTDNEPVNVQKEKEKKIKENKRNRNSEFIFGDEDRIILDEDLFFEWFWITYDKQIKESKCRLLIAGVDYENRREILKKLPLYIESAPRKQFRMHPTNWIEEECWKDEIIKKEDPIQPPNLSGSYEASAGVKRRLENRG